MIRIFSYTPGGLANGSSGYRFASINGKTYQVLRGYRFNQQEIWLQVAGSTALKTADLGKSWEVNGTRGNYIAFIKRYFHYQSERADLKLCFIGNTTAGSRFLALKFMAQRADLEFSNFQLHELSRRECSCWQSYRFGTEYLEDLASEDSGRQAVLVDFRIPDADNGANALIKEIQESQ